MKKIFLYVIALCVYVPCLAQLPGTPDTIFPKKTSLDTVKSEPKLQGGALIDTIHTGKNKYVPRTDSNPKRPKQEKELKKNKD